MNADRTSHLQQADKSWGITQILPEANLKMVAEDDAGHTLDYDPDQAQTTSADGADEWLWSVNIS